MGDTDISINKQEPITIGAIVNPSLLWACYPPGVNKKSTYLKHQIDEELNEYFSSRVNRIPVPPENLEKHARVSVRYNNLWFRGVVMGRKLDGRKELFSVLLVDVGVEINDMTDNMIFELPKKIQEYEVQAFLITLHENHDAAYFKTIIVKENVRHGVLYITKGKEKINLNQILVNSKLAHDLSCEIDVTKYLSRKSSYHRFVLSILKSENQRKIPTYSSSGAESIESANISRSTSRVDQVQTVEKSKDFSIPKDDCKSDHPRYHDDFIERSPESRGKTCIYPAGFQLPNKKKSQVQAVETGEDYAIPKDECKNNHARYRDDFIERSPESRGKTCIYSTGFQLPNKKKSQVQAVETGEDYDIPEDDYIYKNNHARYRDDFIERSFESRGNDRISSPGFQLPNKKKSQVQTVEKSEDFANPKDDCKHNHARYHDGFIERSPESRGKTSIYPAGFQPPNKKKSDHQLVGKESTSKTSLSKLTSRVGQAQTVDRSEENTASIDDSKNNDTNYFHNFRENSPEGRARTCIYPAGSQHKNKKENIRQVHGYGASIQNTDNSNVRIEKTTGLKLVVKSSNNDLKSADSIQISLEQNDEKTSLKESMNSSLSSKNEVNLSGDETVISLSETDNKPRGRIWNNIMAPRNQSNDDKDASSGEECDIELPPRRSKATFKEPEQKSKILLMFNKSLETSSSVDCSTDPVARACFKGAEDCVTERNASGHTHLSKNTVPDSSFSERVRLAASTLRTITTPDKVSMLTSLHSFSNAKNVSRNIHAPTQNVFDASNPSNGEKTKKLATPPRTTK
ncbi:unnamed protein product [Bemisia tabaci]|uniref:Tudor domain-containing protein n=1 Tax=Bemisia tabaci TaxID=7038 RepID=A0A9P0C755_BEMTA|nr:unnamed protein product [Bemisia tabaci]